MNSNKVCFHYLINYLSAILLFLRVADSRCKINCFPPISKFTILDFFFLVDRSIYAFVFISSQLPWILCHQLYLDFYIFMSLLMFLPKTILFSLFENRDHMFVILCSLISPLLIAYGVSVLFWVSRCKDIVPVFACVGYVLFHPSSLPLSSP